MGEMTPPRLPGPQTARRTALAACGSRTNSACGPADFEAYATLAQMVELYLLVWGDLPAREQAWWGDQTLTVGEAIRRAMFKLEGEGSRDGHQRYYSAADLVAMGARLTTHAASLSEARDFETLRKAVEHGLGLAPGRSPLLVYDVAHRLGCYLRISPQHVYLHAGPRVGAERLKPGLGRHRRLDPADPAQLPRSLRTRLAPDQIENFLCIARRAMHAELWD